jgi:hypothetical protein
MKTSINSQMWLTGIIVLLGSQITFAQNTSGIFLSAADFKADKLALVIDCKTEKHRIKHNDFLNKSFIEVKHNDSTYKYDKAAIFGFKECEGKSYRFVGNEHYPIINPNESILLYKVVTQPLAKSPGKTVYYFSKDASSPVQPLTMKNLKAIFPDNHIFHDALDAQIQSEEKLADYDSYHKMFKINHIYQSNSK